LGVPPSVDCMAIPDEQAHAVVQQALDLGPNLFDTAPLYGSGKSEQRIGHVLCQIPRDSFVLCTKVGRVLDPVEPGVTLHAH